LGDVCGARNTQFEQEFFGLFRAETVSAYDWRDRISDFCVADYLAELDKVHVMRYSTPFSLHLGRTSACPPTGFRFLQSNHKESKSGRGKQEKSDSSLRLELGENTPPPNRVSLQRRFPLSGQEAVAFDQLGEGEATGNSGGHYDRGRDVLSPVMRFFESTSLRFKSSDFTRSSPLTDSDSVTFSTCSNASLLASFSFTHKIIAGRR
jgi:hypothetical protein